MEDNLIYGRPATFRIVKDVAFELNDTVVDIEEWNTQVILTISQKMAGIWIYSFDGADFHFEQVTSLLDN